MHRDLKPANIYLADDGSSWPRVKLLDFGIAKFLDADESQGLTTDGMVLGTLSYMAPEIASGKDVSVSADTYSLGVMLYQMLVGSLPFTGANSLETLYAHVHTPPPTPTEKHIKLPRLLESLLLRMLAKKPKDRPSLAEIEKYARTYSDEPESVGYLTPLKLLPSEIVGPRKKRRVAMLAASAAAFCALVLLLLSLQSSSDTADPAAAGGEMEEVETIDAKAEASMETTTPASASDSEQALDAPSDSETDSTDQDETMEFELDEIESEIDRPQQKRKTKGKNRRGRKGKGARKGEPADDAPIDPLRGMR